MTLANIDFSDGPGGFLVAMVPGDRAFAKWRELRDLAAESGQWPILVGSAEDLAKVGELLAEPPLRETGADEVRAQALAIDLDVWLAERREELHDEEGGDAWMDVDPDKLAANDEMEELDDLPAAVTDDEFEPLPTVAIMLLPTANAWEGPAHRGFGGWNGCPADAVLCAFLKRWQERYGVELMTMGSDTIELFRRSPVADPDLAALIARELALVAPDIVLQGAETSQALAEEIMSRPHWFLWWD